MKREFAVFDAERVSDVGDFVNPARPAIGIDLVVVNGAVIWQDGVATGARPGRVLRRERVAA